MKRFINPNRILKAEIVPPAGKHVCDILGFQDGNMWTLIFTLLENEPFSDNETVSLFFATEAECIELCNKLKLIEV